MRRGSRARSGKRDSELVEDALRAYLGLAVVDGFRAKSGLSAETAERLAYDELLVSRSA